MEVKTLAIVQARMGSVRFPGKVIKKINDKSLIELLLYRLSLSKRINKIIVATSDKKIDDELENTVKILGFDVFRGDENDVLKRFFCAARLYKPKSVVRITGDCPLLDHKIVDSVIDLFHLGNLYSY